MFQLNEPIDLKKYSLKKIRLPLRNFDYYLNVRGVMGGWGMISENPEQYPDEMMKLSAVTLDKRTCQHFLGSISRADVICVYKPARTNYGACPVKIIQFNNVS